MPLDLTPDVTGSLRPGTRDDFVIMNWISRGRRATNTAVCSFLARYGSPACGASASRRPRTPHADRERD